MRTIGCEAALIAGLLAASSLRGPAPQPGKGAADEIKPYPGSIAFCTEHITGAPEGDGKPGAHISWTGYYSADSPAKIVRHYSEILGSENHRKEDKKDVWRFPLAKPERVLTVTQPGGAFLPGQCTRPPGSARTIVTSSVMTRQD
jgi:hypothetical protein